MEIGHWKSSGSVAPLYKELKELGLESNICELEAFGFTVVPPEKVGPPEFCEQIRTALEGTMLRRYGEDGLDIERWQNVNDIQRFMLWEDPIFERLALNPAGLGLAEWLLGTDCVLSLCAAWVKGPGEVRTGIHGDYLDPALTAQPEQVNNCNMHFMVTDYSKDDGSISFVPGSHKWRRQVTPSDSKYWQDRAVAVEAPAGSMVIWGNHTWHGSYPKKSPGLRMTLQCEYMRRRRHQKRRTVKLLLRKHWIGIPYALLVSWTFTVYFRLGRAIGISSDKAKHLLALKVAKASMIIAVYWTPNLQTVKPSYDPSMTIWSMTGR